MQFTSINDKRVTNPLQLCCNLFCVHGCDSPIHPHPALYERENARFSPLKDLSVVCHQVCYTGEKSLMAKAGSVGSCPQPSNKKPVLPSPNFLGLFHFSALFWALKTVSSFSPTSQSPSFLP